MTCTNPIKAFLPYGTDAEGKKRLIFSHDYIKKLWHDSDNAKKLLFSNYTIDNYYTKSIIIPNYFDFKSTGEIKGLIVEVPCGKCTGCRLAYARRWSVRSYHEAWQHDMMRNCAFLTLTFNDDMLYKRDNPKSLDKKAFSSWIKRLRTAIYREYGITGVRFFACGEYGGKTYRPHYHVLIYGFNFPDKIEINYKNTPHIDHKLYPRVFKDGRIVKNYISPFLKKVWSPAGSDSSFGFHTISDVNLYSSCYTARYMLKKCSKDESKLLGREQEFTLTSRMPGIGYDYFVKNYKNIIDLGYIDLGHGFKSDIPRYYLDVLQKIDEPLYNLYKFDKLRFLRLSCIQKDKDYVSKMSDANLDVISERYKTEEEIFLRNLDKYVRPYELNSNLHNI